MQSDTIKLIFVYSMAAVVIIGGGLMLFVSRNEANSDFALLVAGFVGAAITFLFGQESATRAVRSYEKGLDTTVVQPD
jgi:NADH:ubiquinone oxidoreductase subunit 6 (subunit J)